MTDPHPETGQGYEVLPSRGVPDEWRAEAIADSGECCVVLFSGPAAKGRAEEYAAFMRSPTDASALRVRIEKMRDAADQQIVALTRQADGARRDGLSLGHAFIQGALTIHECYAKELAALLTPTDTE